MLKRELDEIKFTIAQYEEELGKCPDGKLAYTFENKRYHRYYQINIDSTSTGRRRINSKPALINSLAHKAYLEEVLSVLRVNLDILENAVKMLQEFDKEETLNKLESKFPNIPRLVFSCLNDDVDDATESGIIQASFDWANQPYQPNSTPYKNTIYTSRGLRVRSKNELLIAEKLYSYDIPFRYDAVYDFGGNFLSPDFSFKNNSSKLGFWEHFGMMHSASYQQDYYHKIGLYDDFGFYPWSNFFITFSKENDINLAEIDSMIKYRLLPWMLS